jgi:hypothetical protein
MLINSKNGGIFAERIVFAHRELQSLLHFCDEEFIESDCSLLRMLRIG